jgi:membrane-bound serine protease (ClpP class)
MGIAETLLMAVALMVAAMIMIILEICPGIPTFGVLAVMAIATVAWAVYLCYAHDPVAGVMATIAAAILTPAYTVAVVKILPKTGLGRMIGLRREAVAAGEGTPEAQDLSRLIGRVTTAETLLRPSGFVRIDGKRIVAESESGLIEKGRQVKVIRAGGTSVTVRKVEA